MVRAALEEAKEMCKARLLHFKGKSEDVTGQETRSVIIETNNSNDSLLASGEERVTSKSEASMPLNAQPVEFQKTGGVLSRSNSIKLRLDNDSSAVSSPRPKQSQPSGKLFFNSVPMVTKYDSWRTKYLCHTLFKKGKI
ncbi:hypothetical protein FXO38_00945 [Capsicum annuum]|uniref:Uncharacterized protein n=1 Tax=Capsicum annuum TaxID=4072 RepID=A0A2G2Y8P3_CAPAN|nr:hypothetical protein FXO38_00945 [Capsicum annuum]KAF3685111.1 hypothetical protein FXO37_00948 [Capsicum annuum]PHT66102.1 hypothetical protein T459_30527 [Capsicum annuum]